MSGPPTFQDRSWTVPFWNDWERVGEFYRTVLSFTIYPREEGQSPPDTVQQMLARTAIEATGSPDLIEQEDVRWWNWGDLPQQGNVGNLTEHDILEYSDWQFYFTTAPAQGFSTNGDEPPWVHWESGTHDYNAGSSLGGVVWSGNMTLADHNGEYNPPGNLGDGYGDNTVDDGFGEFTIPLAGPPAFSGVEQTSFTINGPSATWGEYDDGSLWRERSGSTIRPEVSGTLTIWRQIIFAIPRPLDIVIAPRGRVEAQPFEEQTIHVRHTAKRRREQHRRPSNTLRIRGPT